MFILIQSLDPVETDCRQFLIGEAAIFYCILDIRNLFFNYKFFLFLDNTLNIQTGKLAVNIRYQFFIMISQL